MAGDMKINDNNRIQAVEVQMDGAKDVRMRILRLSVLFQIRINELRN